MYIKKPIISPRGVSEMRQRYGAAATVSTSNFLDGLRLGEAKFLADPQSKDVLPAACSWKCRPER